MKNFSKFLSMFLVVVMCFGLFATSAFADGFELNSASNATFNAGSTFTFGDSETPVNTTQTFEDNTEQVQEQADGEFTLTAADKAADADNTELTLETSAIAKKDTFELDGFALQDSDVFGGAYDKDMTFEPDKDFDKSSPDNIVISQTGSGTFNGDTFTKGFAYGTAADGSDMKTLPTSAYQIATDKMTLLATWLKTLKTGSYYIFGLRTDALPIMLTVINVNGGDYSSAKIDPSVYDKATEKPPVIKATGVEGMQGFGVASTSGSYTHVLTVNEYNYDSDAGTLELTKSYLNNLADGIYYLIGFQTMGDTTDQVNLGQFIVKGGDNIKGSYYVTPDYQMWYSGTDPLTFYSNLFEDAGLLWNYKGYGEDVIVPDVLVSTRSSMSGATSVRIDQYWDLGYGYFMLGTNFLSSLSADETYYLQVVDARHPDINYTNVVSFRVGPTLRAIDTDKHVINSTRSLRFRSSSPISEVYVGNIQLTDPADYGVSWDGKTVTLSFEFLNKRSAGNTYTLKVRTTSGEWAATTFQVLTTAQGSASPRTGDESNLGLWAAFLLLSGTAVVVLVPKLRKQDF